MDAHSACACKVFSLYPFKGLFSRVLPVFNERSSNMKMRQRGKATKRIENARMAMERDEHGKMTGKCGCRRDEGERLTCEYGRDIVYFGKLANRMPWRHGGRE